MSPSLHTAVVAGQFYPGTAKELRTTLAGYFKNITTSSPQSHISALVVPHAGYRYSGSIAAQAYATVQACSYDAVVVIAPSHYDAFDGVAVWDGSYATPLGTTIHDATLVKHLTSIDPRVQCSSLGHGDEHALEVQIPFVQYVLPDVPVVSMVMGNQSSEMCHTLAQILTQVSQNRSVLVVASSDLSHFYPQHEAEQRDARVLERLTAFDPEGLLQQLQTGECEACGGGAMAVAMLFGKMQKSDTVTVLQYATSGDVMGDTERVVGYAAATISG